MTFLALTSGKVARVDDADYENLIGFKWYASRVRASGTWYAARNHRFAAGGKGRRRVYMHDQIMGARPGFRADHRDRDGLNNHRENLRWATDSQNCANRRSKPGQSGYRGVRIHRRRFVAKIKALEEIRRQSFETLIEAATAYNKWARELQGEFAMLNLDPEGRPY